MYNHQLEMFLQVADAGSFNKAAQERFIAPSAVIKQINLLEQSLGVTLFERTHRGLTLTEGGKSLYQDAKYIIGYCKDATLRAQNAMKQDENIIRVGTSPMTPGQFLIDLWSRVQAQCPDIKFQLIPFENTPLNAREILRNLGQYIDLVAGVFDQSFLESRGCAALELCRAPVRCAVSIHHRLANHQELAVTDLYGEDFLLIHRGWNQYLDELRDDLFVNHTQINIVDFDFLSVEVFNQCENGNQVLMTLDNWKDVHPLLKVIPIAWQYTVPFGLLHARAPSPVVQQFLDAVQAVMPVK